MSAETYRDDTNRHDPLCPARDHGAAWEPEMCVCDVIAKARADEREKAVQRVNALHVLADREAWTIVPHEACVAAARGEAS